jgi:hypothetical protein
MSERLVERQHAFAYHRPSTEVQVLMTALRVRFIDLVTWMDAAIPESRQKSLAVTALEESAMWAMKALSVTDADGAVVDPPPQA